MRKCLVTGSFDPITLGHMDIIEKALAIFDDVSVAVLVNPDRYPLFTDEQRVTMIQAVYGDRVNVFSFDGLAVDAAKAIGATHLVRGIRDEADLAYETEMADFNRVHGLETVFFLSDPRLRGVSATKAREGLMSGADHKFIDEGVYALATEYLEERS